jgi:hypothetical protein
LGKSKRTEGRCDEDESGPCATRRSWEFLAARRLATDNLWFLRSGLRRPPE